MNHGGPRSIRTAIGLAFVALVIGTALTIAILSYTFTQDAVKQTSREYTELLIAQIQKNIDSYVTHMEDIAEVVHLNERVQAYLTGRDRDRAAISGFLGSIAHTRNDVSLILIADSGGRAITDDPSVRLNSAVDIRTESWFVRAWDAGGTPVISSPHVQNIVDGTYRWVITLSRAVTDVKTGARLGVLLVDLNFSVINDLVDSITLGRRGYLFIVDPVGGIVYHPRQELLYSGLEREHIAEVLSIDHGSVTISDAGGQRIYTVNLSNETGWRTVGVNYVSELVRNRGTIQRYYVYWTLACVVIAVILAWLLSFQLSRPITRLRASMQAVERGDFNVAADVSGNNEIAGLARDFNIMVSQISELVRRNAAEQEQKRKSELLALQNQITPHFLYNTLDSVIWMAEGRQYSNVITTISALAKLLRLSISNGDELISIRDEIEHIRSYLTIQKLRYRDKLDFRIDAERSVLGLKTPKVILQPLVENAIYHGIKNKPEAGRVVITARRVGAVVEILVADDGVGMSEQKRKSLLEIPDDAGHGNESENAGANACGQANAGSRANTGGDAAFSATGEQINKSAPEGIMTNGRAPVGAAVPVERLRGRMSRVGVRNVHERIQLYFGPSYGLSFDPVGREIGIGGTVVRVRLPAIGDTDGEMGDA